jgi:hypothetical protein
MTVSIRYSIVNLANNAALGRFPSQASATRHADYLNRFYGHAYYGVRAVYLRSAA